MLRNFKVLCLLFTFVIGSSIPGFAQKADRGIITGVVTDPSGAAVPGASVMVINSDTGVSTPVSTTQAGNYGSPPLVLGTYTVRVEKEGFKTFVRSGILLDGGITFRQDAVLELGAITQTVEVKAASEMINVSSAEVSHSLGQKYYQDLPVVMGADIRLAESLLHAQPGFVPMQPNGDNMFRGSQFNSRINGGQTMAAENWMDGAAFGYAFGHQQTQESAVPYEAIREMKVLTSTFSAQYGHTAGAFIEYVSKSGSNDFHGGVYEYITNDALNACGFFCSFRPPVRNNDYGFTFGGPIRKDKTFFFTNLALMNLRQTLNQGYPWTVPDPAFRQGNFAQLLTATSLGTDALGRPIVRGQIFDPGSGRNVTQGVLDPTSGIVATATGFVRDSYAGNIIPSTDPLLSTVAANVTALMPPPDRAGISFNTAGAAGDANKTLDPITWLLRIDHTFNPSLKSSSSFWMNERPAVRRCGPPQGCNVPSVTSPESNDQYIGQGFYQRIANRSMHQQFDWVIKPTVFNHTTFSYDRWYMGGYGLSAGVGWFSKLGIQGMPAEYDKITSFPSLNFADSNTPYTGWGNSWQRGFQAINRWQFMDDLTWITGKHTIKAGFEYRVHQFNLVGWARGVGGQWNFNQRGTSGYDNAGNLLTGTGDAYASFLLGQVDNSNFPFEPDPSITERYISPWFNDDIKLTDKLTVSFGLRWDYQTARTERNNKFGTFDPTIPNPAAGNLPGATRFASASNRSFETPSRDSWGPRFGFAYRLSDKNVFRGGYGIYYSGVMSDMWISQPLDGFQVYPTAANTTNGRQPAFWWDNGFPTGYQLPPIIDPSVRNGGSPLAVSKEGLDLPRYQNWSLSWEHQLAPNMLLDITYVGNHGTRLIANRSAAGVGMNMNDPAVLQYGASKLNDSITAAQNQLLPVVQAFPIDPADNFHKPFPGFSGNLAQALRPYPQYQEILWRNLNIGNSIYHSLQVKLDKRFNNGLQFRIAYVWSKLMTGTIAESGNSNNVTGGGIQNPIDTFKGERSLSSDDVPHVGIFAYTYEFPFGHGKRYGANSAAAVNKIIGGWKVAGVQRYSSGRPAAINMSNDLGGLLFNWTKRPNRVSDAGYGNWTGNTDKDRYFNPAAWSDPGPLTFGNASRFDPVIRVFPIYNEDISFVKDTFVYKESWKLRFEAQFGNIFNRTFFCNPNTSWDSPNFGVVNQQCNVPRRIQFGLRLDF